MKRVLAILLCFGIGLFLLKSTYAAVLFNNFKQEKRVTIGASVGNFHITISGYQSPYASIVLTTDSGTFIGSTVADSKGYFSISNALITDTATVYCLRAVDFKRLGESDTCVTLSSNVTSDVTYKDIFLPPTIALSKKQINQGQDAVIYGYTMPNGIVYLNIEGKIITITADATGFYTYTYKGVPAGIFRISATGELAGKKSLAPTNNVVLEALSIPKQVANNLTAVGNQIQKTVPFNLLPFLFAGLIFLIAIGFLLYKLRVRFWVIFVDFLRRRKKMHHDWFLDIWS